MSTFFKITTNKHFAIAAGEFTHTPTHAPKVALQLSGMRKTPPQMATASHSEIRSAELASPTPRAVATVLDLGKRLAHLVNASGHTTVAALWSAAGEVLKGVHPQLKTGAALMRADHLDQAEAQMAQAQAHGAITDPGQVQGAADVANYAVSLVAQSAVPLLTTVVAARTLGAPAALLSAQVFNTAFNANYQIHSTGEANLPQAAAAALPVSAAQMASGALFARSTVAAWSAWGAAGGMSTVGGQRLSTLGANVTPGTEARYGQGALDGALMGMVLGPLAATVRPTARPLATVKANPPLQLERGAGPKRLSENSVIDLPQGAWSRVDEGVAAAMTPDRTARAKAAPLAASTTIHSSMRDRGYSIAGRGHTGIYEFPHVTNDGWGEENRAQRTTSSHDASFSAAWKASDETLRAHVIDTLLSARPRTREALLRLLRKNTVQYYYIKNLGPNAARSVVRSMKTTIANLGTTPEGLEVFLDQVFGHQRAVAELEALNTDPLVWGTKHKPQPSVEAKDLEALNLTQVQVLRYAQTKLLSKKIATELQIAYKTVRNEQSMAFKRLGVSSLEELERRFVFPGHQPEKGPEALAEALKQQVLQLAPGRPLQGGLK